MSDQKRKKDKKDSFWQKKSGKESSKHSDKLGRKAEKELEKLKQERDDLEGQYQRALADYHNLLKRVGKEKQELVKYANEEMLKQLLPVFDNLKLSLEHASGEEEESQWVQGVKYVVKQFREVLEENGVKEIKVSGESFDPEYMEAVEGDGEVVVKELRPGYTLNDKVIIPARVSVQPEKEKE